MSAHRSHDERIQESSRLPLCRSIRPEDCLPQQQSPLFSTIPAEIRNLIFKFALLSCESEDKKYDQQTCYVRLGYFSPRRTDTALLRTCKRVYQEAFFRPWTSAEHTLFLTQDDRKPARVTTADQIARQLSLLTSVDIQSDIDHVRVFAQMYMLESGYRLQNILNIAHFRPKFVTICIRHTDWWYWEDDEQLRIAAHWVNHCRLPDSVICFRMELESLHRKRQQIDSIAEQMRKHWFFRRSDGTVLVATSRPTIETWTGTSGTTSVG